MRRAFLVTLLACAVSPPAHAALPPVKHVFIVVLENKAFEESFGPDSKAPYLSRELTRKGQLLTGYHGTSHASLGNYLTMISGQASNPETQGDCPVFKDILPGVMGMDGQVIGQGCVFPAAAKTIGDQLQERGLTWRQYAEDMGNTPGEPQTCRHPAMGTPDRTQSARENDQFATRHVPFLYFHSVIDEPSCDQLVVPLDRLTADLAAAERTPNYVFVTPDLCSDAHDEPCADGRPGGLQSADAFLKEWVPRIMASPAYTADGMLLVTYDEATIDEEGSEACCEEPTGPNTPQPGIFGRGGGRTGAVLLSPFVRGGSVNETPYNHYSLLRSVEDIFGLAHLGYAGMEGLKPFGDDVFNAGTPAPTSAVSAVPPSVRAKRPTSEQSRRPAAGCTPRRLSRRARGRRKLIRSVVRHGRELVVVPRVAGRLRVRLGRRTVTTRRVRACHAYTIRLPNRRGRAVIEVRSRRAFDRR
jgi:phosphatidylinositol-3-phosphatase